MTTENPLIESMTQLRENFAKRAHEVDAAQQQALLDALHQLLTSTESLGTQLQSLVRGPTQCKRGPRLYLVK